MTNQEIAKKFEQFAALLEIQGANKFRIRAYQQAAAMIEGLGRELQDIYAEGGKKLLDALPGIGADLSSKIEELVTTGKLKDLIVLEKKIPPSLLDIMYIQGMGPKRTKFLFEQFHITTLAGLEKLLSSGKLEKLSGWGAKSVANIKQGIEQYRGFGTRRPLGEVLPLAKNIVEQLRATGFAQRIEIAGSLRRGKDTIGDIDVLAISEKPKELIDAFIHLSEVKQVVAQGSTKCTAILHNGLDCDLRVLKPEAFGAGMYYFTGSKSHNIAVRSLAVKKGLTVSEYGVFRGTKEKKGKLVAGKTEEEIFKILGMDYIEPELRENAGEIEAAQKHTLPKLIAEKDVQGDLHVHSTWSDGTVDMRGMIEAAKKYGRTYIAIADHGSSMGMVKGIKMGNYKKYIKDVRAAAQRVKGIEVLAGAEVDIEKDGSLYLPDSVLKELDWVLASVHGAFNMEKSAMTKRIITALQNPYVRGIAHPTARWLQQRMPVEADWEAIMKTAARQNKVLELNAHPSRLDVNDVHCRLAKLYGVKIVINSDAHHPHELDLSYGIITARRGWLEKKDVLNTMSFEQLNQWLKKR